MSNKIVSFLLQERIALSLADLISCCCMLTANILIREAFAGYAKGEKASMTTTLFLFSLFNSFCL